MVVKTKSKSILRGYEEHLDDQYWIVEEAAAGVPATAIFDLVELTQLTKAFFAGMLNLSIKTLDRYRVSGKDLNRSSGEMVLKIFSLFRKGEKLFGTTDEFKKWIEKPAYGLGYKVPIELMQTAAGIDLVMDELIRIEYGNLA